MSKFSDMQTFAGESMTAEGGMAFGYYKDGAHHPTFAYISKSLEAEKVGSVILFRYSFFLCNDERFLQSCSLSQADGRKESVLKLS